MFEQQNNAQNLSAQERITDTAKEQINISNTTQITEQKMLPSKIKQTMENFLIFQHICFANTFTLTQIYTDGSYLQCYQLTDTYCNLCFRCKTWLTRMSALTCCSPSSNANIYGSSVTFTSDGKIGPAGHMRPFYLSNTARDLISEAQKKYEIWRVIILPTSSYSVVRYTAKNTTYFSY